MGKKKKEMPDGLANAIDQLAMQVIMVEADDVMTLGTILEHLETIGKLTEGGEFQPAGVISRGVKKLVEKIVLGELPDPKKGLEILGSGVRLIQQKVSRSAPSGSPTEETAFWQGLEPLIQEGKLSLPPEKEGQVKSPQAAPAGETAEAPLDMAQDMELINDFISEALEHLGSIELEIINLEQNPGDKEHINAIFRPFHTIKGVSGFLNLKEINQFSHAMESLLDDARNGRLSIHQGIIDFILEAVDLLKSMILELKEQVKSSQIRPPSVDIMPYLQKIEQLRKGETISGLKTKEESESPPLGEILTQKGIVSPADIQDALKLQREEKKGQKIGEILIQESKAKPREIVEALREQKQSPSPLAEATVKVDTGKLDTLVDLIGELVIAQSLVAQNAVFSSLRDPKLNRDFSHLKRITTDLQRISMSLRMVPIRQTFQKMIRLVRDLARKSGKQVDLIMSGEETEIDRNMVDTLYEPLVHLIRNAVDHGIEPPPKRLEAGKPEMGQIFLRAFQKGGYIVIEIEDDGQGLNRPKILKKGQEKGLVAPEASLTEHQIDNLIFEPGFSTADQITDVSGRGVGMDVVRKTIEKLKGSVEIFSTGGKGSRFVMRVPLTLAIMDGIVVQIGEDRYIIPTVFIKETLRPSPNDVATVQKQGELIKVRNSFLPLIRLHRPLGVRPQKEDPWDALVVVVENEGLQKGLMVDDLVGKQEVVIKNLGEKLKAVKGVAGATIMGDGRVGLILDVHGIFEIDLNSSPGPQVSS